MHRTALLALAAGLLVPASAFAQDAIESAMSAAPMSISGDAAIVDWDMHTVREGTNEWTCLPDRPDTPGNDPWCITDAWMDFLHAYVAQTEPTYTEIGFAYMPETTPEQTPNAEPQVELEGGTYEIIRNRLVAHGKEMRSRLTQLNEARRSVFGPSDSRIPFSAKGSGTGHRR